MKQKLYAVVDLETTGGRAARDKVIEKSGYRVPKI